MSGKWAETQVLKMPAAAASHTLPTGEATEESISRGKALTCEPPPNARRPLADVER